MALKAVLFDLDMTLVDSSAIEEWRRLKFWPKVMANLSQVKPFTFLYGSAHDLPAKLRAKGFRIAVVTSAPGNYAEAILKQFGVPCDVLVSYQDTDQHKPDPAPLIKALQGLGVAAHEAVHVGDAPIDTEASFHAGVKSVGAGWGVANFDAFSGSAPDLLLMKPSTLLELKSLEGYGYLAETCADGLEPRAHLGAILPCGGSLQRYALGRYIPREDARHASSALSNLLLQFKNEDAPARALATALSEGISRLGWRPDCIVTVPPKPSQTRDRFASLCDFAERNLVGGPPFVRNALLCAKDINGYKAMGGLERAAAMRGAFATDRDWRGKRVLLVDDVLTSGETTGACARVLAEHGAAEVRAIALGRTQQVFARKTCPLPKCGRPMRVRTNRFTGIKFWGCSGYLEGECEHTEQM